jgi:hypothetical protein
MRPMGAYCGDSCYWIYSSGSCRVDTIYTRIPFRLTGQPDINDSPMSNYVFLVCILGGCTMFSCDTYIIDEKVPEAYVSDTPRPRQDKRPNVYTKSPCQKKFSILELNGRTNIRRWSGMRYCMYSLHVGLCIMTIWKVSLCSVQSTMYLNTICHCEPLHSNSVRAYRHLYLGHLY